MVPLKGIEPPTCALRMRCSTPELQRRTMIGMMQIKTGGCGRQIFFMRQKAGVAAYAPGRHQLSAGRGDSETGPAYSRYSCDYA